MSGNVPLEPMELGDTSARGAGQQLEISPPFDDILDQEDIEDEAMEDDQEDMEEPTFDGGIGGTQGAYNMNDVEIAAEPMANQNVFHTLHEAYDIPNAAIDLEQYASSYESHALIQRLMFIADHCSSLKHDAIFVLVRYIQANTSDIHSYQACMSKLCGGNISPNDAVAVDKTWIETKQKSAAVKLERLEQDLKHYKANSIKDSVRRGYDDLAEHCVDMGDLNEALKSFSRSRDYCSSAKNQIQMCMNVIRVSVYLANWMLVQSYVQRAHGQLETMTQQTSNAPGSTTSTTVPVVLNKETQNFVNTTQAQLHAASGLQELSNCKYYSAAQSFLKVTFDHLNYNSVISAREVGVYGALCALATYERPMLAKAVINNPSFKLFLELEPQMLHVLRQFNAGDYEKCLTALNDLRPNLMLDLYLARHVSGLYDMIRKRGMVSFFAPYMCADMRIMARAFNTTVTLLQDELCVLIFEEKIKARIDSDKKLLIANVSDERAESYDRALLAAKQMQQHAHLVAIRAATQRAKIHVRIAQRSGTKEKAPTTTAAAAQSTGKGAVKNAKAKTASSAHGLVPDPNTSATTSTADNAHSNVDATGLPSADELNAANDDELLNDDADADFDAQDDGAALIDTAPVSDNENNDVADANIPHQQPNLS